MKNINGDLAVALGTFDGFHLGHKRVIDAVIKSGGAPRVLLFNEHPQKLLLNKAPDELLTKSARNELLEKWGIKPIEIDFNEIKELAYEDFFYEVLLKRLGAKILSCGFNYRFGKNACGDSEKLSKLCEKEGIIFIKNDAVLFEGEPISSTRIRSEIKNGRVETANAMLGRSFSYDFIVVHGDARGRTIDSPTINQFFPEGFVVPQYGVYASYSTIEGKKYPSVTNIGVRPTIEGKSTERSETNIVGYNGDLYDKNIKVHLLTKIREEMRFNNLDELKSQISRDREKSVKISKEGGYV